MATKSQQRHYAKTNNVSMAQAKQHFIDLAIANANKGQLEKHGSVPHDWKDHGGFKTLSFNWQTEAMKMMDLIKNDPPVYNVKSNKTDFTSVWNNEEGFLIAVVPVVKQRPGVWGFLAMEGETTNSVAKIASQFQKTNLNDNYVILSTYATSDMAYKQYKQLVDAIGCVFVGYSTPKNLSTLFENVEAIKCWSKDKPYSAFKTAEKTA